MHSSDVLGEKLFCMYLKLDEIKHSLCPWMGQRQIGVLKREDTDNKMKYNCLKRHDTYSHNVGRLGRG